MRIDEAIMLIKHLRFTQELIRAVPRYWEFDEFQSPSYVLGYLGDVIFNAIHDAGGMAGEW